MTTQSNERDHRSRSIPDIQATLAALAQEVKTVPRGATFDDGVFFRLKPDRRCVQGTVLPYRERRAVRR